MSLWHTAHVEGDPPRYETFTEAEVVFDQGMYVVIEANDGSHSESLLLDGKHYTRDSANGAWEQYPHRFDSSQMEPLDSSKHFQIVNGLIGLSIVGEETLRGIPVSKVTGSYDMQARALDILGQCRTTRTPAHGILTSKCRLEAKSLWAG